MRSWTVLAVFLFLAPAARANPPSDQTTATDPGAKAWHDAMLHVLMGLDPRMLTPEQRMALGRQLFGQSFTDPNDSRLQPRIDREINILKTAEKEGKVIRSLPPGADRDSLKAALQGGTDHLQLLNQYWPRAMQDQPIPSPPASNQTNSGNNNENAVSGATNQNTDNSPAPPGAGSNGSAGAGPGEGAGENAGGDSRGITADQLGGHDIHGSGNAMKSVNADAFGPAKNDTLGGSQTNAALGGLAGGGPGGKAAAPGTRYAAASPQDDLAAPAQAVWGAATLGSGATNASGTTRPRTPGTADAAQVPRSMPRFAPGGPVAAGAPDVAPTTVAGFAHTEPAGGPAAASGALAKPVAKPGDSDELTDEEKKELAAIQKMLVEVGEKGQLDAATLGDKIDKLKRLSFGHVNDIVSQLENILSMTGSSLTMEQRQEVLALAGRLGLNEVQAMRLAAAIEQSPPPSPERRHLMRWQRILLKLETWWERFLRWLKRVLGLA